MELQHTLNGFHFNEAFFDTVRSKYAAGKPYEVYKNPNYAELREISQNYEIDIRGIAYENDLYVWDAFEAQHDETMQNLKSKGIETYNSIPCWLAVDEEGVYEVTVGVSALYTRYDIYIDTVNGSKVSPKLLKMLQKCTALKKICTPDTKWSTRLGT